MANVDRTPRNANLLVHGGRLNLIDHGAALYHQHGGLRPDEQAGRPFPQIAEHVLLPVAGPIAAADERLRGKVTPELLRRSRRQGARPTGSSPTRRRITSST